MKRTLLTLCLLAVLGLPAVAHAQTSGIPLTISYQGKVTDAGGLLIGSLANGGTPVNREVIFRVYDHPTTGVPLYSEKQNVTIANGEFSVLIGLGSQVNTEAKPALDIAFNGAIRYLGVTVDDGNTGADLEISPRQQIATTPFAFRAKLAEGLINNAVSTASMIANNAITGEKLAEGTVTSAKIATGTITAGNLANNTLTSAKILDGTIATADLAVGSVTADRLGSDVGLWSVNGTNVYRNSNVGVGVNPPVERLHVSGGNLRLDSERYLAFGAATDNFSHSGKSMSHYGVGSFVDTNLGAYPALWLAGFQGIKFFTDAGSARMTITNAGRVGIGTTGPDDQLGVYSSGPQSAIRIQSNDKFEAANGLRIGINSSDAIFHNYEPGGMIFTIGGSTPLMLHPDGRASIGGDFIGSGSTLSIRNTGHPLVLVTEAGIQFTSNGDAIKQNGSNWATYSDMRLKTDVTDLSGSLDKLLQLHSVTFRYKDETKYAAGLQTGFIAQEVEKIFPNWVRNSADDLKFISMSGFEALTVQALRELRAEKDAQIAALESRATSAEARLAAIEKQLAALVAASQR